MLNFWFNVLGLKSSIIRNWPSVFGSMPIFALLCVLWSHSHLDLFVHFVAVSSRSLASKTPVGFIGLGNMGNPMAKNLLKHGYPIIATDVFPESCKEVQELGAQVWEQHTHKSFLIWNSPHSSYFAVTPHRLWTVQQRWQTRRTALSQCFPLVPMLWKCTLDPVVFWSALWSLF